MLCLRPELIKFDEKIILLICFEILRKNNVTTKKLIKQSDLKPIDLCFFAHILILVVNKDSAIKKGCH